ncbi:MAG: hypothetical protein M1281_02740 [Chloroflexi bacterium]|nr:hypothetical protein [Chloroflexota bacterium]
MATWDNLRKMVQGRKLESSTLISDCKSVLAIIDQAETWKITPPEKEQKVISNLRTIVHESRDAIQKQDKTRLAELFHLAGTSTTSELRLRLGISTPKIIPAQQIQVGTEWVYQINLTQAQLDKIQKVMKNRFTFEQKGDTQL